MADTAYQRQYRQEHIKGFEKGDSLLRRTTTTEAQYKGNECTFLVADSGGAVAQTRGVNGKIPSRPDNLNQYVCLLQEYHDKPQRTGYNIFSSQGDGRRIMQETSRKVINRTIDQIIHTELVKATNTWGAAAVATLPLVLRAQAKLGNNFALGGGDGQGDVFAAITPAFRAKLLELKEFASHDYVSDTKFEGVSKDHAFSWLGINWIIDPALPDVGTAVAKCFMYNRMAIGCAMNTDDMNVAAGYNDEEDYSYARSSIFAGSKLLQNSGIIVMEHDDATVLG